MHINIGQKIIDIIRGKSFNLKRIAMSYLSYKKSLKHISDFSKHKIIFKFDDLVDCGETVLELDKFIKREKLKVCWGIIGKSLENPDPNYIIFLKENNLKNYHFFNHGYLHLGGPKYEFFQNSKNEQEAYIRKTQNIVLERTGIKLNSFGAPCNHIDNNTKLALENFSDIKYWYYGLDEFKGTNIERLIDMENGVGNPDFIFFYNNLNKVKNGNNILTLQGHPYMWNETQKVNFYLIVKFLKRIGCEFIFPEDIETIGENND